MSYKTCLEGVEERLARVAGIKGLGRGEPDSVANPPYLYSLFDSFEEEQTDNARQKAIRWTIQHRLVLRLQDNAAAENELIGYLETIPDAVAQDPKLNGRLHHNGYARITGGDGGFIEIPTGGTMYRTVDFMTEVLEITNNA